ncbi:MAG: hypothetical protein A2X48_20670 [Lentisphaerae bacterium GWF2_49_21]|nr:MAG: hypothetical protein A2X48_20670 [Lentisphaerae bacterium GWF2_49_21]
MPKGQFCFLQRPIKEIYQKKGGGGASLGGRCQSGEVIDGERVTVKLLGSASNLSHIFLPGL